MVLEGMKPRSQRSEVADEKNASLARRSRAASTCAFVVGRFVGGVLISVAIPDSQRLAAHDMPAAPALIASAPNEASPLVPASVWPVATLPEEARTRAAWFAVDEFFGAGMSMFLKRPPPALPAVEEDVVYDDEDYELSPEAIAEHLYILEHGPADADQENVPSLRRPADLALVRAQEEGAQARARRVHRQPRVRRVAARKARTRSRRTRVRATPARPAGASEFTTTRATRGKWSCCR